MKTEKKGTEVCRPPFGSAVIFITIIPRHMNMHMSACVWLFAYCLRICNELYNLVLAIGGIAEKSRKHLRGDYSAVGGPLCFEPCKSKQRLETHRNRGVNPVYASHREDFGLVCRTVSGGHGETAARSSTCILSYSRSCHLGRSSEGVWWSRLGWLLKQTQTLKMMSPADLLVYLENQQH